MKDDFIRLLDPEGLQREKQGCWPRAIKLDKPIC